MNNTLTALTILSGLSFIIYGISCLVSDHMRVEFVRFGLARFRVLVGWLELLGGSAQIVSLFFPLPGIPSAGGLALLMLLGVITRFRIGDGLLVSLPAIGYMVINTYLFFALFMP